MPRVPFPPPLIPPPLGAHKADDPLQRLGFQLREIGFAGEAQLFQIGFAGEPELIRIGLGGELREIENTAPRRNSAKSSALGSGGPPSLAPRRAERDQNYGPRPGSPLSPPPAACCPSSAPRPPLTASKTSFPSAPSPFALSPASASTSSAAR